MKEIYMRKWDDNIKLDLNKINCEAVDWIQLTIDVPLAGVCENANDISVCLQGGCSFFIS
jgi:hypothetical protein